MDATNPEAKAAILEVIENQISENDPPETVETLNRLISEGFTEEDAMLYIGQAVCVEIWDIITNQEEFDLERYKGNLARLPKEPEERRSS